MTFFPHSNTYSLTNFHTELSLKYHLVTGGAGFIGSCYVLQALKSGVAVVNLDKLTYAGNLENLAEIMVMNDTLLSMAALKMRNFLLGC